MKNTKRSCNRVVARFAHGVVAGFRTLLVSFALLAAFSAFAAESAPLVKTKAPDASKDVKIHFYIDGHRKNPDANMHKNNSLAYVRAINALRIVLTDRDNPIDLRLRLRDIGKNVEVNVGKAFLLKPDCVFPVSLSKDAKKSDFGTFGKEPAVWNKDVAVKQILQNEQNSENIVVCVISNDPAFSTKHGCFHLEAHRGIMFFMLHARRESVNTGFLEQFAWNTNEWAAFLRESMGPNANDIANAIVDTYYALSSEEEKGLNAVGCTAEDEGIKIDQIRSLPKKQMWKTTLSHNGAVIPLDKDVQSLTPKSGQNKIVAQVLSPTGVAYTRTWEHDVLFYRALRDEGELYSNVKAVVEKAASENIDTPVLGTLSKHLDNSEKPVKPYVLEAIRKMLDDAKDEINRIVKVREVKDVLTDVRSRVGRIETEATGDLVAEIQEIKAQVVQIEKKVGTSLPIEQIEQFKQKADDLKPRIEKAEKIIAIQIETEKERSSVVSKINARLEWLKSQESATQKCVNTDVLFKHLTAVKEASTVVAIKALGKAVDQWEAKFEPVVSLEDQRRADLKAKVWKLLDAPENAEEKIVNRENLLALVRQLDEAKTMPALEEIESKIANWKAEPFTPVVPGPDPIGQLRNELKAKVQALLDAPENAEEKIENRAELEAFVAQLDAAKTKEELEKIKGEIEGWKSLFREEEQSGGFGFLSLLLVLAIAGGAWLIVKKSMSGKTVATISFQKSDNPNEESSAAAKLNKPLNLSESLGCAIDIRVTPKKNDEGNLEYECVSPKRTVWLLALGGDKKRQVADNSVALDAGQYQIFDNEKAMKPMGLVRFEPLEF